jgi:hypothetical protein
MRPGTLGSVFNTDIRSDPALAAEYKGAVGREAKAAFREDWCKKKAAIAERKINLHKEQRHELTDQIVGTYKPFRKVWEAEGLDKDGNGSCNGGSGNGSGIGNGSCNGGSGIGSGSCNGGCKWDCHGGQAQEEEGW